MSLYIEVDGRVWLGHDGPALRLSDLALEAEQKKSWQGRPALRALLSALCPFKMTFELVRVQRCYFLWFLCSATNSVYSVYTCNGSLKFFISFPTHHQFPSFFFPPRVVPKRVEVTMRTLPVGLGNGKEHHHWCCSLVPKRKLGSVQQRGCPEVAS